jgi:uncharacterized MnhB-related membrane protein
MIDLLHLVTLALIVASGVYAVWSRDLIASVVSLGAFSLILSLEFFILQAPDVAIAEAGIGAGLSTAIYVVALRACRRLHRRRERKEDPR